jgi:Phosphotransferase enzyme family
MTAYPPRTGATTVDPPPAPPPTALPTDVPSAERLGYAALRDGVPEIASGALNVRSLRVLRVSKQRAKRIVAYQIGLEDASTGVIRVEPVIGKFYGRDRAGHADVALHALWAAGFRPPARCVVPRPYGHSNKHGVLLQGPVDGRDWADHLGGSRASLARASAAAAAWLAQLHATPSRPPPALPAGDAADVRRFAAELGAVFPAHAGLHELAERVAERLLADPGATAPAHGDFHPKNVFLAGGRVAVIDFDTFAAREPAWDLGYAVGQLLCMSRFRHGTFEPGLAAAAAFLDAYAARLAAPPWPRVATFVARTLLQSLHFELYTLANGRFELLELWPALIEDALDSDEPGALAHLVRGR